MFCTSGFTDKLGGGGNVATATTKKKNGNGTTAAPTSRFDRLAKYAAWATGRPWAFMLAVLVVAVWGITGPIFQYSDTWQLVINTGTTIVTFLMVFLIQCTQNRDTGAMQIKLDELIRSTLGAHNALIGLEEIDEEEFQRIRANYERLAEMARECREKGTTDTDRPEVEAIEAELEADEEAVEAECREKQRRKGRRTTHSRKSK
jgi:low affinity Fe/Cu permease